MSCPQSSNREVRKVANQYVYINIYIYIYIVGKIYGKFCCVSLPFTNQTQVHCYIFVKHDGKREAGNFLTLTKMGHFFLIEPFWKGLNKLEK